MFWNNVSIKTKLFVAFGGAAVMFACFLAGLGYLLNDLVTHADNALKKTEYAASLTVRELDHFVWTNTVRNYIQDGEARPLDVTLDENQCAFGKWFLGDGRTVLEQIVPGVQEVFVRIEEPHRLLHRSAGKIEQALLNKQPEEAQRLFDKETEVHSKNVTNLLENVRQQVRNEAKQDKKDYLAMASYSRMTAWMLMLVSVLGAVLFGFIISRSLKPLHRIAIVANEIAAGNLSLRLKMKGKDEIAQIADCLDHMVDVLSVKISEADRSAAVAREQTETVRASLAELTDKEKRIAQILDTMHETSGKALLLAAELDQEATQLISSAGTARVGSDTQQQHLEEISVSMTQMSQAVGDIARSASAAAESAASTLEKAHLGSKVVVRSVDSIQQVNAVASRLQKDMEELGVQANSIGQVMNVISDIADQTNLLALNAAIEAARAGDAGRGFAVVADEVRKLAEKTMQATQEVGSKIASIQQSVAAGVSNMAKASEAMNVSTDLVRESGQALQEIVDLAGLNTGNAHNIAAAADEHAVAATSILSNLEEITSIARQTATGMHSAVILVAHHKKLVENLNAHLEHLKKS